MDTQSRVNPVAPPRLPTSSVSLITLLLMSTLIVLMIVPDGFNYALLSSGRNPESGSLLSRLLWLGLLFASVGVLLWRAGLFVQVWRRTNPFMLAFVALAILSIVWSLDPVITLRRDVRIVTILFVCMASTLSGWQPRCFQNAVRPVLTVMLIGSILFGLVAPSLAIHSETSPELIGAWRGLTNHKNSLGALASVTFLLWMYAGVARETRAWRALGGCAIALVCLSLSRSATAAVATFFSALCLLTLTRWPRSLQHVLKYVVGIAVVSLTLYALVMLRVIPGQRALLAPVTLLTGMDTTFTGRSEIWAIMLDHVKTVPFLGSGYGAYWVGPDPNSPSYEFINRMNGFYPGSAHNGYLEVLNDLGAIGLLCLFGFLAYFLRQTLQLFSFDRPQAALYLALFMQQAVANLSESHWFSVLSVQFVLITFMTATLARNLVDRHMQFVAAVRRQQLATHLSLSLGQG